MLRDDIANALPEGVGQPLFSRVLLTHAKNGRTATHWVRAGDICRRNGTWVFTPRWDGDAFLPLWEAALVDTDTDRRPRVAFAVPLDGRLTVLAEAGLGQRLMRDASREQRLAQKRRPRR